MARAPRAAATVRRRGPRRIPPKKRDGRTLRASATRPTAKAGESLRHQAILDAAALLMQQRGFVGTTVEDVAGQLALTKAAFYYYVQNKEELLFQMLSQTLNVTMERIQLIERSGDPPSRKMSAIVDSFVRLMADRPEFFTVYFQEKGHLEPEHLRAVTKTERAIVGLVERVYRQGVAGGSFRPVDPAVAAFGILGLCFWVYKWYRPDGRLSIDDVSRAFQALAAEGYLTRERPAR